MSFRLGKIDRLGFAFFDFEHLVRIPGVQRGGV